MQGLNPGIIWGKELIKTWELIEEIWKILKPNTSLCRVKQLLQSDAVICESPSSILNKPYILSCV